MVPYGAGMPPSQKRLPQSSLERMLKAKRYGIHTLTGWNLDWTYTFGLYGAYQHPELIVFGDLKTLLMQLIRQIKAGHPFLPGREYPGIVIGAVDPQWYDRYLPWAVDLYTGHEFPAAQLVIPDLAGRYPWQAGYSVAPHTVQPVLFTPTL